MELGKETRAKAIKDHEFRTKLIANPNAVLAGELATNNTTGANVVLHENKGNVVHLIIPKGSVANTNHGPSAKRIMEHAQRDAAYHTRLINDPHMVLNEELGVSFSKAVQINIHMDTADTVHVVVPENSGSLKAVAAEDGGSIV